MANGFTVAALFFGDYPQLARRCLGSIVDSMDPNLVHSIRVGLNAVSQATREVVHTYLEGVPASTQVLVYDTGTVNRFKYPLMRKILRQPAVTTQFFAWFDDDSCLAYKTAAEGRAWWSVAHVVMQQADQIGSIYYKGLEGQQAKLVYRQPWYNGKPLPPGYLYTFATGGFWMIRTRILQQWDWPPLALIHNGGDTLLGELMRQQNYRLRPFKQGVWVNADAQGRESKAPRRGISQPPFGAVDVPADPTVHDFSLLPFDPRERT